MENKQIESVINNLSVGDMVNVNDWDDPAEVKAITESFVLIANDSFYSIVGKLPNSVEYNGIELGCFVCGPDHWIFGCRDSFEYQDFYKFKDKKIAKKYLEEVESGKTHMSLKNRAKIEKIEKVE